MAGSVRQGQVGLDRGRLFFRTYPALLVWQIFFDLMLSSRCKCCGIAQTKQLYHLLWSSARKAKKRQKK